MKIYIKNQDGSVVSYTPAALRSYLQQSGRHSVVGFCPTLIAGEQYLCTVFENQLRQHLIRLNTNTTLPNYTAFRDDGVESRGVSNERPQKIPPEDLFTPEEIKKILNDEIDDVIFRFVASSYEPNNRTEDDIFTLLNKHADFTANKLILYQAITDLISTIETNSEAQRISLSVYKNIDAVISREQWKMALLPTLKNAKNALLRLLSVSDVLENNPQINRNQRDELQKALKGKKYNSLFADFLIQMSYFGIPLPQQLYDRIASHKNLSQLAEAFIDLKEAGFNTHNEHDLRIYERVASHNTPRDLTSAFIALKKAGCIAHDILSVCQHITAHQNLVELTQAFRGLLIAGFDTHNEHDLRIYERVASHNTPRDLTSAFIALKKADFTAHDIVSISQHITAHRNLVELTQAFHDLLSAGLKKENVFGIYEHVASHKNPPDLVSAFIDLYKVHFDKDYNASRTLKIYENLALRLASHDNPKAFASMIITFKNAGFTMYDIFEKLKLIKIYDFFTSNLAAHDNPKAVASMVIDFKNAGFTIPDIFKLVELYHKLLALHLASHDDLETFSSMILAFKTADFSMHDILTSEDGFKKISAEHADLSLQDFLKALVSFKQQKFPLTAGNVFDLFALVVSYGIPEHLASQAFCSLVNAGFSAQDRDSLRIFDCVAEHGRGLSIYNQLAWACIALKKYGLNTGEILEKLNSIIAVPAGLWQFQYNFLSLKNAGFSEDDFEIYALVVLHNNSKVLVETFIALRNAGFTAKSILENSQNLVTHKNPNGLMDAFQWLTIRRITAQNHLKIYDNVILLQSPDSVLLAIGHLFGELNLNVLNNLLTALLVVSKTTKTTPDDFFKTLAGLRDRSLIGPDSFQVFQDVFKSEHLAQLITIIITLTQPQDHRTGLTLFESPHHQPTNLAIAFVDRLYCQYQTDDAHAQNQSVIFETCKTYKDAITALENRLAEEQKETGKEIEKSAAYLTLKALGRKEPISFGAAPPASSGPRVNG